MHLSCDKLHHFYSKEYVAEYRVTKETRIYNLFVSNLPGKDCLPEWWQNNCMKKYLKLLETTAKLSKTVGPVGKAGKNLSGLIT